MDPWAASSPWRLWIMLLWTQVYKHLFESLLAILWTLYLEVEVLNHMVILRFMFFEGTSYYFSQQVHHFTFLSIVPKGSRFPTFLSSKPTECTTPRVNPQVNYRLWVMMMCQCKFTSCNKGTISGGMLIKGKAMHVWLAGGIWNIRVASSQFCC